MTDRDALMAAIHQGREHRSAWTSQTSRSMPTLRKFGLRLWEALRKPESWQSGPAFPNCGDDCLPLLGLRPEPLFNEELLKGQFHGVLERRL